MSSAFPDVQESLWVGAFLTLSFSALKIGARLVQWHSWGIVGGIERFLILNHSPGGRIDICEQYSNQYMFSNLITHAPSQYRFLSCLPDVQCYVLSYFITLVPQSWWWNMNVFLCHLSLTWRTCLLEISTVQNQDPDRYQRRPTSQTLAKIAVFETQQCCSPVYWLSQSYLVPWNYYTLLQTIGSCLQLCLSNFSKHEGPLQSHCAASLLIIVCLRGLRKFDIVFVSLLPHILCKIEASSEVFNYTVYGLTSPKLFILY